MKEDQSVEYNEWWQDCKGSGLPAFEIKCDLSGFLAQFRQKAAGGRGKSSGKGSGKSSGKILTLIEENSQITIPELAEKLSISTRAIEKQLRNLQRDKRLERIGPAKGGYWKVIAGNE